MMNRSERTELRWDGNLSEEITVRGRKHRWRVIPAAQKYYPGRFYVELIDQDDQRVGLVQQYPCTQGERLPDGRGRGDPSWPTEAWARQAAEEKTWELAHPHRGFFGGLNLPAIVRRG